MCLWSAGWDKREVCLRSGPRQGSKDPRIREESNWRSDGGVEVNGNSCVHIRKHFNAACTPMCRNTPVLNDAISKRCFSKVLMTNEQGYYIIDGRSTLRNPDCSLCGLCCGERERERFTTINFGVHL